MFPDGPPGWPPADPEVLQALQSAFQDGSWGRYHGPHVEQLAADLSEMLQREHVTLCSSGTIAVELALRGLGVAAGDEVILAAYDFPGNFRSVEAVGARPVLVDIRPESWCLDEDTLTAAFSPQTRAVIVSHLHGGLASMPTICKLAQDHGAAVVEDACQSPGAVVDGQVAGSWGDVGVLSFGGSKLLTAGRGGALATGREDVHQRIKVFSDRGNAAFPLSELQAAVLIAQLPRLRERNERRAAGVKRLRALCGNLATLRPVEEAGEGSSASFYKLAWMFQPDGCAGRSRQEFIDAIKAEGVAMDAGFRGFARRSMRRCRKVGRLEHSQSAADNTLILHHPILLSGEETMDQLAEALTKVSTALADERP